MINLRDRGHRALAATTRVALLDAHRRWNAGDQVDVWSRHLLHELPRVNVHGIEKPPLAFGENQIERERALARATDPGDNHKLVPGNGERKVLQIVLAGTVNHDG